MNLIDAIILGIVEGISEFLPISSTGHLILTSHLLGLPATEFVKSFEIAIQLGAILSVVVLYGRSLLVDWQVIQRVAVAFLPTAILGFIFYKLIKKFLLGNSMVVVWSLFIGGLILILFERFHRQQDQTQQSVKEIPLKKAFWIGVFQSVAMIPGVSRSGATIVGGLLLGIQRKTIVEFSFLLAVPTMLAAAGLDLMKTGHGFSTSQMLVLAVGFFTSFVVALASIKFLLKYIQNHNFISFGVYRIIAAVLFWCTGIKA